jgi:MFS superfamily sulfate permease-like transporter
MNFAITLKKALLGFITGLASVIIASVAQGLLNYHLDENSPQFLHSAWLVVAPLINGHLVGLANWLKNYGKS